MSQEKLDRVIYLLEIVQDKLSSSELLKEELEQVLFDNLVDGFGSEDMWAIMYLAVQHENCPESIMWFVVREDGYLAAKMRLAKNKSATAKILEALLELNNQAITLAVLKNPNAPRHLISPFLESDFQQERELAQKHPSIRDLSTFL